MRKIDEKVLIALIKEIQKGDNAEANEVLQQLLGDAIKKNTEKSNSLGLHKSSIFGEIGT